jgi:hypothetical protein
MEIPKQLKDDIWDYCRANDITDIEGFTIKMVKDGFTVEKYGYKPNIPVQPKKEVPTPTETPKTEVSEPLPLDPVEEVVKELKKVEDKPAPKKDIYGETPRGSFGSNLLD